MEKIPVVAVIGPTASGKSDLAVHICLQFNGEAVSADSMQIYKGMDIATAKPTKEEMQGIKHHMMDFLDNTESFSVAEYQRMAGECIYNIHSSGKLPVVVGGTGLYVDTLLDNIKLLDDSFDKAIREKLLERADNEGIEKLYKELMGIDSDYAEKLHINNTKKIVRALEVWYSTGMTMTQQIENSRANSPYDVCYIGLGCENRQYLYDRIDRRVDLMIERGLFKEAEAYLSLKNVSTSSQAIGYKELRPCFDSQMSAEQAVSNLKQSTRRYAKRQLTWFRRNERINWLKIDKYQSRELLFSDADKIVESFMRGE